MTDLAQLEQWDRENFFHPSTHLAEFARGNVPERIMETAEGVYITDNKGNRLLDGFAGLYCVNVGYGRKQVSDAIAEQAQKLAYYHSYVGHGTEASITLSKMVLDRMPSHMSKVYYGLSGSDANETNIKLVWYYNNVLGRPEKKKIITRNRGYHGSGLYSGSLTGLGIFRNHFDLPLSPILTTDAPYYYHREKSAQTELEFSAQCAASLEEMIMSEGADTIAAFIGEPCLGTGGIVPPPEGYWDAIQPVLEKYDILFIADEVVTGFGRLGSMTGSEHYGLKPDLITLAKGLTSAYAPLSGTVVSKKMWKVLEEGTDKYGPIGHGWTYSAHPICAAAGVANLKLVDEMNLVSNAAEVGAYLKQSLQQSVGDHTHVGEVRGQGMLCAIEFVEDKDSRKRYDPVGKYGPQVAGALLNSDIIGRAMPHGDILGLAPPLCLTHEEADIIVAGVKKAVEAVF